MGKSQLATRIKELRVQKRMSQEFLSEESGLSLRTIQRIENGETNPTGDSLKRLTNALDVSPDELMDWAIKDDVKYLIYLNLSALSFIFFPLLGILIPFMLWSSKKGKIKNIDQLGRDLVNFEVTWTMILFGLPLILLGLSKTTLMDELSLSTLIIVIAALYSINLMMVVFNTMRISNEQMVAYYPKIKFLR